MLGSEELVATEKTFEGAVDDLLALEELWGQAA